MQSSLPSHLSAFVLSKSNQIMDNFIRCINGFHNTSVYYGETDCLYMEKKYWNVLDRTSLVDGNLCQVKNDYEFGASFNDCSRLQKKYRSTIDKYGIIQEHRTFKGFDDSKRLLDRSQRFKKLEGKKISAMLPKSLEPSFNSGVVVPLTRKLCNERTEKLSSNRCNNQFNENREFEANLNELKTQAPH